MLYAAMLKQMRIGISRPGLYLVTGSTRPTIQRPGNATTIKKARSASKSKCQRYSWADVSAVAAYAELHESIKASQKMAGKFKYDADEYRTGRLREAVWTEGCLLAAMSQDCPARKQEVSSSPKGGKNEDVSADEYGLLLPGTEELHQRLDEQGHAIDDLDDQLTCMGPPGMSDEMANALNERTVCPRLFAQ